MMVGPRRKRRSMGLGRTIEKRNSDELQVYDLQNVPAPQGDWN